MNPRAAIVFAALLAAHSSCSADESLTAPETGLNGDGGGDAPPDASVGPPDGDASADNGDALLDGGNAPADGGNAPASDRCGTTFRVVVLPDTQFYSKFHPAILNAQIDWIRANAKSQRIAFVLHEGDIVDDDVDAQWAVARQALSKLDGQVPYLLAVGNHDFTRVNGSITRNADRMNANFPASGFTTPQLLTTFEDGKIENAAMLVTFAGMKWLLLSLEFGPRDAVLAWAGELASRFADVPAMVVTHAYMYLGSDRYDWNRFPSGSAGYQYFSPFTYGLPGPVNDGELIWEKLVSKHANIQFVFSGHMTGSGVGRKTSMRLDGSFVHEMLANYQGCPVYVPGQCIEPISMMPTMGGDGFLRLLTFIPDEQRVKVETYSPFLDANKLDEQNTFSLEWKPVCPR